jgi:hypothetical protein
VECLVYSFTSAHQDKCKHRSASLKSGGFPKDSCIGLAGISIRVSNDSISCIESSIQNTSTVIMMHLW